jgi:hypothetical protein
MRCGPAQSGPATKGANLHPVSPTNGADDREPRGPRSPAAADGRRLAKWTICVLLAAVAALSFLSGGYLLQRTAPVVFALAALVLVGIWRGPGFVRPSRPYFIALCAFAGLVVWTGLSVLWSTGPDLTWVAFDVAALYLLVMVAAGLTPGGPLQLRLATRGFALVVLLVAVYAYLGKTAPDVFMDAHTFARLRAPIGYWNVLAALVVMALPVFLVSASRREGSLWTRALAGAAVVLLLLTFFFTFSRGGYIALAAALLVYFVFSTRRLSAFVSLAVPVMLTALVLLRVRGLETLFTATTDDALRTAQGHALAAWCALALVLAGAVQVAVAFAERRWTLSPRQARVTGVVVISVLVIVPLVIGASYVLGRGGTEWIAAQYHAALTDTGPANSVERLTSLGTSGRLPWYREALRGFRHHPIAGTGAGTFRITDELYRTDTFVAKHSHSQWLNVLSELGVVGFVLFLVAIGGLVAAAFVHAFRDGDDPYRSLLAACQAAIVAFVVHISIDWDWDMASVTVAFVLLAGVSAAYIRDRDVRVAARARAAEAAVAGAEPGVRPAPTGRPRPLPVTIRVLATAVVVFGVASWALPYLAERATMTAQDQLSRGQLAAAESGARRAAALDPLSVDPLITLADVQAQAGDLDGAVATLERAVRLQPYNYEPYYQMGSLLLYRLGDSAAARAWYQRALELNPMHPGMRSIVDSL